MLPSETMAVRVLIMKYAQKKLGSMLYANITANIHFPTLLVSDAVHVSGFQLAQLVKSLMVV